MGERLFGPGTDYRSEILLHMLDKQAMVANTGEMLKRFIRNAPPIDEPVETLSGGQRQVVAIARRGVEVGNSFSWTSRPQRLGSPRPRRWKR